MFSEPPISSFHLTFKSEEKSPNCLIAQTTEWKHYICGICVDCQIRLGDRIQLKSNPRKLFIPMDFDLGTVDALSEVCGCHICHLAALNGGALKAFLAGVASSSARGQGPEVRRCNKCFGEVKSGGGHTNCGGKQSLLDNLKTALPLEVRQQFALETLKETRDLQGGGDSSVIHLMSHKGGKATEITMGSLKPPSSSFLTSEDARAMQLKHNFNQSQLRGLLADYRCLNGKASVEPYILEGFMKSKESLKALYTVEMVNFVAKAHRGV